MTRLFENTQLGIRVQCSSVAGESDNESIPVQRDTPKGTASGPAQPARLRRPNTTAAVAPPNKLDENMNVTAKLEEMKRKKTISDFKLTGLRTKRNLFDGTE